MERSCFFPQVADADLDAHVVGGFLRVFHEHIAVAVVVEDARIQQFVLRLCLAAQAIGDDKIVIGISRVRVLVEILHVGVGRGAVEIEIVFLDVLAVVAFAVGQAEQPFLEDRVLAVPEGQGKTQDLMVIADPCESVLPPTVGP